MKIGKAAVPTLSEALGAKDHRVRISAAEALVRIGPAAKDTITPLSKALGEGAMQWYLILTGNRISASYANQSNYC